MNQRVGVLDKPTLLLKANGRLRYDTSDIESVVRTFAANDARRLDSLVRAYSTPFIALSSPQRLVQ